MTTTQSAAGDLQPVERWSCAVVGGGLLYYGMTRLTSLRGLAAAVVGGGLLLRSYQGPLPVEHQLGLDSARKALFGGARPILVKQSMLIMRPRQELYQRWRKLDDLPTFMHHLESVEVLDEQRSHWKAKGPLGVRLEWDAEILEDVEGEMISWKSLPDGDVDTTGAVRFQDAPGGRGSVVSASILYQPVAGSPLAHAAEWIEMGLDRRVREDLRRFKNLCEAGEIPTNDGQPAGRRSPLGAALPM